MIVDAHVHVLPDRLRANPDVPRGDPWFAACHASPRAVLAGPDELVDAMQADGVDVAVCLGWPFADPGLLAEQNDWLATQVRRHPGRLVAFGCVNPADPGAAAEAVRCARLGLRGLGELNADAQGWSLDDLGALDGLAGVCVETGLTWNLHSSEPVGHAYPGKGTATPDRVLGLAEAFGDLRIIAAHLGGGLPFHARMPEIRDACRRNLWFDTAAMPFLYEAGAVADVADLVGADRVMLGSDYPLLRPARLRRALDAAGLGGAALAAVSGGTASALLAL